MPPRKITQVKLFSDQRWLEHTKRKVVVELMDYCLKHQLSLDSDIIIDLQPSPFLENQTEITARVWTR